jgi:hypothetical protein
VNDNGADRSVASFVALLCIPNISSFRITVPTADQKLYR